MPDLNRGAPSVASEVDPGVVTGTGSVDATRAAGIVASKVNPAGIKSTVQIIAAHAGSGAATKIDPAGVQSAVPVAGTYTTGAATGKVDLTRVKPYGDTLADGAVQLSFTLPVAYGDEAKEAARRLAEKMGLAGAVVVYARDLGGEFTFCVVYGRCMHTVDFTAIKVPKVDVKIMPKEEVDQFIREKIGRKIRIIGACIESDAHTVGIDAIMNMKGYNGHKGLEAFHEIEALNLGAQVPGEELVALAIDRRADAILVSQVVTQKDIHLRNLTKLMDMLEAENLRSSTLAVIGGPRISQELAQELGFDAGFGPGTYAEDVASYIVQEMARRRGVTAHV